MSVVHQINLLPKDTFEQTPTGKFLQWAISVGRWIIVFTDLIVISSFFSRIYFDTKLDNLYDNLKINQAIIEATSDFEGSFRLFQKKLSLIKSLNKNRLPATGQTSFITSFLPNDVYLNSLSVSKEEISLSGTAFTQPGMFNFIGNLLSSPKISKVNVSDLSFGGKEAPGAINFTLTATLKKSGF